MFAQRIFLRFHFGSSFTLMPPLALRMFLLLFGSSTDCFPPLFPEWSEAFRARAEEQSGRSSLVPLVSKHCVLKGDVTHAAAAAAVAAAVAGLQLYGPSSSARVFWARTQAAAPPAAPAGFAWPTASSGWCVASQTSPARPPGALGPWARRPGGPGTGPPRAGCAGSSAPSAGSSEPTHGSSRCRSALTRHLPATGTCPRPARPAGRCPTRTTGSPAHSNTTLNKNRLHFTTFTVSMIQLQQHKLSMQEFVWNQGLFYLNIIRWNQFVLLMSFI